MSRSAVIVVLATAAAMVTGCGTASAGGDCGLLPASVQINGHEYNADSRYGRPLEVGRPLAQPVQPASCATAPPREVTAYAIRGIPSSVAVYAPEAFGKEFILINEDAHWKPAHSQRLTGHQGR